MLLSPTLFKRLCRARQQLSATDEDAPGIAQIAKSAGLSLFHFIRVYRAVFGLTPHQYRTQQRLDRAQQLLASRRSVTAVCMEVGFSSLGSFSTLFTRRFGETPKAFQRRVQTIASKPGNDPHGRSPGCFSLMLGLPSKP